MAIRMRITWAILIGTYMAFASAFLLYMMYTATVSLPDLPDTNAIHWWREAPFGWYLKRYTCNDTDVVCDTCCYCYTPLSHILEDFGELSQDKLVERQCEKRLPQAIIIGAMKSGTYALRSYLSYHPDIAMAYDEPWFWNKESELSLGLERYRDLMHYSTPGQVTMEKTPDYYHEEKVPELISSHLPDVKILMIMKDPIKRAISHYNFDRLRTYTNDFPGTFEEAVMEPDWSMVNELSPYISRSVYHTFVRRWLQHFPKGRFLALDGDAFVRDPLPQLRQVEKFLGVRPFFNKDTLSRDQTTDFWCLNKPIRACAPQSQKHPPHPKISSRVLKTLTQYYRPHNKELAKLLDEPIFEWYSRYNE